MPACEFKLRAVNEWATHDPFGKLKDADASGREVSMIRGSGAIELRAARGGYASFRLLVEGAGEYRVKASVRGGLEVDLYRAWYHHMRKKDGDGGPVEYWPDALVPVKARQSFTLPDPDNRIPGQTVQEFWVDVFIPADAKPGTARGKVTLAAGAAKTELPVRIEVLELVLPDEPVVQMDHNSYGCRGCSSAYPRLFRGAKKPPKYWQKTIDVLHNRYRIFHEHRGLYHNLGYGHSGDADPIYRPETSGRARELAITDWTLFDAHYGPLLDGSCFRDASPGMPRPRRAAGPLHAVYTPFNPDWPADYLGWGEAGYEVEMTRGLKQFDEHLRANGWTGTIIEFFFNHKKRYHWYEWDGDEPKFEKDDPYHATMAGFMKAATAGSPVKWRYRMDASWRQKAEWNSLAGLVDMWVCGGFIRWYREEVKPVIARGDSVWTYGSYPPITAATSGVLENLYRTWVRDLAGFCAWNTTTGGDADHWFDNDGASIVVVYPGERFGIAGPVPSVRLKVLRNGIQDVDLIDRAAKAAGNIEELRAKLIDTYPVDSIWDPPPPAARELPTEDWDSVNLQAEHEPVMEAQAGLDPQWWSEMRERALGAGAGAGAGAATKELR